MRRAAAFVLLTAACGSVTPPERPDPYAYAVPAPGGFNLVFHWPPASLPVRVWAQPSLRRYADEAVRTWEALSLYGEFHGVLVADSARADVVMVRYPDEPFDGEPSELLACRGFTFWSVNLDTRAMTLPFVTILIPRSGAGLDNVDQCLMTVAAHELGHSLGLLVHSEDPADLMYARPSSPVPTPRDRVSFVTLYHSPATAGVPSGR
jgi:predicted Zn-dependent protease